jgi:sugar (pentulose or hexulose) kinase
LALRLPRPGWHGQDAEEWWTAGAAALREVAGQVGASGLAGLAIAHLHETFPAGSATAWAFTAGRR